MVETASGSESTTRSSRRVRRRLMAKLAPDLPESYSASLKALKSMGAVVLVIALDRQFTQYYWHNLPKEAGFPFLALVEHTNYMDSEHYGGDHIIYCGDYLDPDHEYFSLSKEELLERFLPAFTRFNPDFDRSWVKDTLALEDRVRPARAAGQPLAEHPARCARPCPASTSPA